MKSYKSFRGFVASILKNGLKISPKKCQPFRTELQYIGNNVFIQEKGYVKPFRSGLEAL